MSQCDRTELVAAAVLFVCPSCKIFASSTYIRILCFHRCHHSASRYNFDVRYVFVEATYSMSFVCIKTPRIDRIHKTSKYVPLDTGVAISNGKTTACFQRLPVDVFQTRFSSSSDFSPRPSPGSPPIPISAPESHPDFVHTRIGYPITSPGIPPPSTGPE